MAGKIPRPLLELLPQLDSLTLDIAHDFCYQCFDFWSVRSALRAATWVAGYRCFKKRCGMDAVVGLESGAARSGIAKRFTPASMGDSVRRSSKAFTRPAGVRVRMSCTRRQMSPRTSISSWEILTKRLCGEDTSPTIIVWLQLLLLDQFCDSVSWE